MWYKTPSSPATARASATLIRGGTGASTQRAKAGSHSDTGRGSSSMTLYVPGSAVIAATVAATASSIWTNDQTPEPSPMIVDMPLRTCKSEEHTSELQSLMRISYAVFCLKKNKHHNSTLLHIPTYSIQVYTHYK